MTEFIFRSKEHTALDVPQEGRKNETFIVDEPREADPKMIAELRDQGYKFDEVDAKSAQKQEAPKEVPKSESPPQ